MSGAPVRPASLAQMVPIAEQVARIERAAAFLANGMSLGCCPDAADDRRRAMPAKMIGNGLRELDLFLTDLIAEARRIDRLGAGAGDDPGVRPGSRLSSAAEAWHRARPQLGLKDEGRMVLRGLRAAQNQLCFGRLRAVDSESAMQRACADYARLAGDVLVAVRARRSGDGGVAVAAG